MKNSKKIADLIATYNSFPHVIYRKIYLIPQRPHAPRFNYFIAHSKNLLEAYQTSFPEAVNQTLIARAKLESQREALIKQYLNEANKKRKQYSQVLKQYYQTVIYPLKQKLANPVLFYYKDHKEQFNQYWKKKQTRYNLADVYNIYHDLPVQTKKAYEQIAQRRLQQDLKLKAAVEQNYKIPDCTKVLPHFLYLQETYGKISRQLYKKFHQLPQDKQKQYKKRAQQVSMQKKDKFLTFLKNKGLDLPNFKFIQETCKQIDLYKKNLKQAKKSGKSKSSQKANSGSLVIDPDLILQEIDQINSLEDEGSSEEIETLVDIQEESTDTDQNHPLQDINTLTQKKNQRKEERDTKDKNY